MKDDLTFLYVGLIDQYGTIQGPESRHRRCIIVGLIPNHANSCQTYDQYEQQWGPPIFGIHPIINILFETIFA
jgi:hypothetical protein